MRQEDHQLPFPSLTGRGVKVAVVDSGIDPSHPKIRQVAGGVGLSLDPDGRTLFNEDFIDCSGHGTACAGIIRKKAPEVDIFSIRIFDDSLGTEGTLLIAALQWAVEHGMDVVNLSLGTTDVTLRDPLSAACRQALAAGLILVAAEHNEGQQSYPAALPQVIGVTAGRMRGPYAYFYRPGETIECVAHGDEQRLCWLQPREIMTGGTSFAAPHIAGIAALIRQAHPRANLQEVRVILQANASEEESATLRDIEPPAHSDRSAASVRKLISAVGSPAEAPYSWIGRAALYPYNKEMHSFVRYLDQLSFDITGIADPVGKGLAGKDAGETIGLPPVGLRILPRLRQALKSADTLILGYVDQLGRISRRDVLRESVRVALDNGLHVFSFLAVHPHLYPDLHALARQKGLRIVCPSVSPEEVQQALQSSPALDPVDIPVLGVFGTSAQQGKFTLQLALRRRLLKMGYRVGQIGTEHHSALFGMDFAFPMGYASPLQFPLQWYAPYLDIKMREICRQKQPDILLVGSQSGTIPYNVEEHGAHSLPSLAFLLGTKPDACILVVNSIDADAYIQDTIDGIRALTKAPTILLAMSDKEKHIRAAYGRTFIRPRQMDGEEIEGRLRHLEDRFGLPAISILSEKGQQRAVETVINYFASNDEETLCQMKQASSSR